MNIQVEKAFDSADACKHDHYVYFFKESFHQASGLSIVTMSIHFHDDVIKWKHFPRYWPFVRGIHQ